MRRKLDSRALELFVAVAESLSFRRAAESLHLSQPPLSRAIRELEERLDAKLFERNRPGVALTDAGQRLLPQARRVLRLIDDAQASITRDPAPRVLRLGLTNALEPLWFDGLATRIAKLQEGLSVRTTSASSPHLVHLLRAGKLHAAFIALPTETAELDFVELERYPLCVALPSAHRLARKRTLRLAELEGEAMFWFDRARQPAFYDHAQAVFAQHRFAPATLREPDEHHVLLAEVASGKAIALLPSSFRALRRVGVAYRALVEGQELSLGVGLVLQPHDSRWRQLLLSSTLSGTSGPEAHDVRVRSHARAAGSRSGGQPVRAVSAAARR